MSLTTDPDFYLDGMRRSRESAVITREEDSTLFVPVVNVSLAEQTYLPDPEILHLRLASLHCPMVSLC